jgi:hypothetical protein
MQEVASSEDLTNDPGSIAGNRYSSGSMDTNWASASAGSTPTGDHLIHVEKILLVTTLRLRESLGHRFKVVEGDLALLSDEVASLLPAPQNAPATAGAFIVQPTASPVTSSAIAANHRRTR